MSDALPDGWRLMPIGDCLLDVRSGFASGEDVEDGTIQVRMNNVTTDGQFDWSRLRRVPEPTRGLNGLALVSGDVLFNCTNSPDLVGKSAAFERHSETVTFSNHFLRLRPNRNRLDSIYLTRWLNLQWRRRRFFSMCRQWVNQATVPKEHLVALEIPLPPIAEQRRIATILDAADALRQKTRKLLSQFDQVAQSIFMEMFAFERSDWPTVIVAHLAAATEGAIRTGPFGSQLLHSEFVNEGVAVLGIDNAVTNEFRWVEGRCITKAKHRVLQRYTVQPGDVIITIMGTCGRCAVIPDNIPLAINSKHLCCITLDQEKCLPEFLHAYFLQHPTARAHLQQAAKGAIMAGLNMGIIKALPVVVPPIDMQRKFVERIRLLNASRGRGRESLEILDRLFACLQFRAFRGEL